ncbi:MAG TPA: hypothetical protein DCG12_23850 [Planctomycetaceae bacterium]|nr:hypothetical protein [Planctomycetaceae bacterium]
MTDGEQEDHSGAGEQPDPSVAAPISDEVTIEAQMAISELELATGYRLEEEAHRRRRRKSVRVCFILFALTFLSTTIVGADFLPLRILYGLYDSQYGVNLKAALDQFIPSAIPMTLVDRFWQSVARGCTYSVPLMVILFAHEMGHYLQAVRYRIPASLPYFIPLPLPPMGTMGAVILQGEGGADRRKMFDVAVSGPIAGLVVTIPVLLYGIHTSGYIPTTMTRVFEFGQPLVLQWLIESVHGEPVPGLTFHWNGYATAGWVGVFITAMNLLPIGQLDGGHILYTLIRRPAHYVAWGLILTAVGIMIHRGLYSYLLLLVLLMVTGPRHPPTADDSVPLGITRHIVGWLTLSFLLVGFTLQPIVISDGTEPTGIKLPPTEHESVPLPAE